MRNAWKFESENLKVRNSPENVDIHGRIILIWISETLGVRLWTGNFLSRVGSRESACKPGSVLEVPYETGRFLLLC